MSKPLTPPSSRPFLNVERSVQGRVWRDRLDASGQAQALALAQIHGHGDLLSRVLAGRGITPEDCEAYLDPSLRRLMPDPTILLDMDKAAVRMARAIMAGEKIAIFGDYDVDGASSSALLADYFTACGTPFQIHIPDRIFEGYGPNVDAIQALAAGGAKLLVTVDCGTTSHNPLGEAAKLGLDPIVLDHHQAPADLPEAIIVNPNRQDDLSGLGQLCAAGVVFMLLVALNRRLREQGFFTAERREPDLLAFLDLVALATVADVAPLTGLNRAFVTKGLAVMQMRQRAGLRALFDCAGAREAPKAGHLGFLIGPRINAGGRIGDAALGARLLIERDQIKAEEIARRLDTLNRERQVIEAETLEQALLQAEAEQGLQDDAKAGAAIVTASEDWHPGIVGLVATRLKDKYRCPAFAVAFNESGIGTGSGRSIAGVDLGHAVREAVEAGLLIKGGGHAMAAGITLVRDHLAAFRAFLEEKLTEAVTAGRSGDALFVDAALTASGANPALMASLEKAGPFGAGNPEPVFVLPAHRLMDASVVGNGHVRFRAEAGDGARIEGIAFRSAAEPLGDALLAGRGTKMHFAGTLMLDRFGGRERVQMRLTDLAPLATQKTL